MAEENLVLEHWGNDPDRVPKEEEIIEEVIKAPEAEVNAKLKELEYTEEDIKALKPENIKEIIEKGTKKVVEEPTETVYKIKVGEKEKEVPEKDYKELVEYTINKFGKEKFETFDDETKLTLIADQFNYKEFNKTANEKSRNLARERTELDNTKKEWQEEIEKENSKIKADKAEVDKEKAEYEQKLKDLAEKEKKLDEILKEDAEDIVDINEKTSLLVKQARAEEKKEENKEKKVEYEAKIQDLEKEAKKISTNATVVWIQSQINELQDAFPELKTEKPASVILTEYKAWNKKEKGEYPNKNDVIKAQRIFDVIEKFANSKSKEDELTIVGLYEVAKFNYPELPAPTEKKGNKINIVELNKEKLKETLLAFLKAKPSDPQTTIKTTTVKSEGKLSRDEVAKGMGFSTD
jgi:hypothetical protein